ncbi:hypothetical protein HanIR_Chr15g0732481 [Helianthus annuus]|nr:hypothetical protein HanIR_Chr15g0732481 [Helianthus annuus]
MKYAKGNPNNGGNNQKSSFLAPVNNNNNNKMMKKNRSRLGGGGLSLQAFANANRRTTKQREFYKNAKYVNKYKKSQKHPNQGQSSSQATELIEVQHFYAVKRLRYMRRAPQAKKPTKKHQKMRFLVASCNYTRREAKKPQALRLVVPCAYF